jgi:hypothetical protein
LSFFPDPYFLSALRASTANEIADEERRIHTGMAADWADYRHRCGILIGLRKLDMIIDKLTEDKKGL